LLVDRARSVAPKQTGSPAFGFAGITNGFDSFQSVAGSFNDKCLPDKPEDLVTDKDQHAMKLLHTLDFAGKQWRRVRY
jgi:hypothetical protein